ncbi:hypothetical protein GQ43DRAFT_477463 [Delitschia confertaspora ATCC 74209]|uniref:Geranylgeranyl pyrophosphate synthetase n=1 Tax=Delitschia confertaspora ATCC 74209 TaxID=1513339 RepID=A0A9P4JVU9_9PLEO|nr:hypothetical protein GQ43DRAFT_477463 [Delitschia confertaspora ATCC 74209]
MPFRGRTEGLRFNTASSTPQGGARGSEWKGKEGGGTSPWRGNNVKNSYALKPQSGPDISLHPLGDMLTTITNDCLDTAAKLVTGTSSITDCKYIGSYNWLDAKDPTIIIPGKPPNWTPLLNPEKLKEDSGVYYRDPNAARFAKYPMEPSVQAVLKTDAKFPTDEVDIFACGSTMGNLLRFVRHYGKPFRFKVQVIGNTVFFSRKENSPTEVISGVRGFGHTFPEAYTTWEKEVKGSESNQRLIQYDFAGLKCIVRFECDGYFGDSSAYNTLSIMTPDATSLTEAFLGTPVSQVAAKPNENLTILNRGSEVPQQSIFDLKTRSGRYGKQIDMLDILPLLWVRQVPNFIIAYHDGFGLFKDIKTEDVSKDLKDWEVQNQDALKRFAVILRQIIDFAMNIKSGVIEVYCPSVNRLEIRKPFENGFNVLPQSLRSKWENGFEEEDDSDYVDASEDVPSGGRVRHENEVSCIRFNDADDEDDDKDFTACSAESCGYCGHCSY